MVVRDLDMHNSCNFGGELKGPLVRDLERGVEVHNPVLLHVLVEADPQDKPLPVQKIETKTKRYPMIFNSKHTELCKCCMFLNN
ncbi:hypothetical protein pipiens_003741 [Culex pipiens pipiens]|uniref:Uncharacterized protein n=1 Tax=Culex pipiens pipiens TaxID=38569 RepID=A0ABD1CTF9_CULPP